MGVGGDVVNHPVTDLVMDQHVGYVQQAHGQIRELGTALAFRICRTACETGVAFADCDPGVSVDPSQDGYGESAAVVAIVTVMSPDVDRRDITTPPKEEFDMPNPNTYAVHRVLRRPHVYCVNLNLDSD